MTVLISGYAYAQVDIFGIIIIVLMLFAFKKRRADEFLSDQIAFVWMLFTNLIILLFDSLTGFLDGNNQIFSIVINNIATCGMYLFNPLMGVFYIVYCDIKLGIPEKKILKRIKYYCIPFIINAILAIASLRHNLLFFIDSNNVYHRGNLIWLSFFFSGITVFYALVKTIIYMKKNRKKNKRSSTLYLSLLAFPIPPIIGAIMQAFLPNFSVVWVSTVISMFIIFVNLQNAQITIDPLTGVYNRGQLDTYVQWKINRVDANKNLYLIVLDIDSFKKINDKYGHIIGDKALEQAAECLRKACCKNDFLLRYGGDEFVIIKEEVSDEKIYELLEAIDIQAHKITKQQEYDLCFSAGFCKWSNDYGSVDDFISQADSNMYKNKQFKRSVNAK